VEGNVNYAFVIRLNEKSAPQPLALTFVGEPRKAFRSWLEKGAYEQVDLPRWGRPFENLDPIYTADVDANTFIVFAGSGRPEVYAYKIPDAHWKAWLYEVDEQDWGTTGSGRRPSFIQKLQTWRFWTKKQGAEF